MRKLIPLVLIAIGLTASAQAQETYSLAATAGQVTTLTDILTFYNVRECQDLALVPTCTQAQACTAANAPGGAACTAAQARSVGARIWPVTQAGREEFVLFMIAAPRFQDLAGSLPGLKSQIQSTAASAATVTAKNNSCAQLGLPAGCYP